MTTRIVVDAMGGDHAPGVVVEGCLLAAREGGVSLLVTGPVDLLQPLFEKAAGGAAALARLPIQLVEAPEVIAMDEMPVPAIRKKKKSSIVVGMRLVRDGQADAFVSAGNTGAVMAAAALLLGRLPGVERPALAALLPNSKGSSVLLDVGANVDAKPQHFEQWAIMGACYVRSVAGIEAPRVALLSMGEEDVKGSELLRRVHQDLKRAPVNFVGNIDGKDVYTGHADVIVTDGFTGNAILKVSESLLKALVTQARRDIGQSLLAKLGMMLMAPTLRRLKRRLDHSEYGAVPLLGVAQPVFIGHGSSNAKSVSSGIRQARAFSDNEVNRAIEEQLRELGLAAAADVPAAAAEVPDDGGPAARGHHATAGEAQ